ncbi:low-density lipoprotein receptor-related protein 4-like isoform X2 [Dreissena polymorpha]|nr:low-density lipoprotein receptor-related protein 4-like isoform X2 [Dreissena polymorpha]
MTSTARDLIVLFVFMTWVSGGLIQNGTVIFTGMESSVYFSDNIGDWITRGIDFNVSTFNTESGYSLACDSHKGQVVISNPQRSTLLVYDVISDRNVAFYIGTSKDVGQVTIDWRAGNVYWADAGYGWIAMKELPDDVTTHNSLDPHFRVLVDRRLDMPTGLAVFPEKYFLFWADAGSSPKIERSNLMGLQRKVIVYQSLLTPRALAIDHAYERLYWTDEARGTVESCDMEGSGRSVLLSKPGWAMYGIAVYQGSILCTGAFGTENFTVAIPVNQTTAFKRANLPVRFGHLALYSRDSQPRDSDSNRCESALRSCDQICVVESNSGHTECYCHDGYAVTPNGLRMTCEVDVVNVERSIMFTNGDRICAISVNILTLKYGEGSIPLTVHCHVVTSQLGTITRFALDIKSSNVYFTNGTHIAVQPVFKSQLQMLYTVNTTGVAIVDMDFDWKSRQLLWIENGTATLFYTYVNGTAFEIKKKTVNGGGTIISLAVDPHNSIVYFIIQNDSTYRMQAWARQNDTQTPVPGTELAAPTDLEYDRIGNRLVWIDDGGFVGFLSLTDNRQTRATFNSNSKRNALVIYKNFIVSSSAGGSHFRVLYMKNPDARVEVITMANVTTSAVLDLHVWDSALQPQDLGFCDVNNGHCQQICLPDANAERCACALGYTLNATDGRTCSAGFMSSEYIVIFDEIHNKIYQVSNGDSSTKVHALETGKSDNISALAFDSNLGTVVWNDRSVRTVRKKTIGSEVISTLDIVTGVDTYLAIDGSTGNVYVLADNSIRVAEGRHVYTVDAPFSAGRMKRLALAPQKGRMAWTREVTTPAIKLTIVRADMDGSNERDIAETDGTVDDLAFDPDTGDVLFWCNSVNDEVKRMDVSLITRATDVYKGLQLHPVAIDVAGPYLYLVPRDERKLLRMSSNDGSGRKVVFESPLLGSLINFYVKQTGTVPVHPVCSNCNGQCSHVCLPDGDTVKCACPDGKALAVDRKTCPSAAIRCQVTTHRSIMGLQHCCPDRPGAVCAVNCSIGFTKATPYRIECRVNGEWNVSLETVCSEDRSPPASVTIIAAAAGGGGAVVVIITIIVVCCCRSRNKSRKDLAPQHTSSANGLAGHDNPDTVVDNDRGHGYSTLGAASADPPMSLTKEEQADGGVYHEIDETALRVELPPKPEKQGDNHWSRRANKYSKFPMPDDKYSSYLTAVAVDVPPPDYPFTSSGQSPLPLEDADGYLASSSVSGGSLAESRLRDFNSHSGADNPRVDMGRYSQGAVSYNARGYPPLANNSGLQSGNAYLSLSSDGGSAYKTSSERY